MVRLLIPLIMLAAIAFIIYNIIKFFSSVNAGKGQVRKDIISLRSIMDDSVQKLIPMTEKEMELLSINHTGTLVRQGFQNIKSGSYTTIFDEPLLAYAYKQYPLQGDSLLLVSTSDEDFIYHSQGGKTKVYLNNQELGYINSSGDFYNSSSEERVAHIDIDQILSSHPVIIGGKEMGEIVNASVADAPNPRAYLFLEPMNPTEDKIFKALTFLSLVEETIN